MSHMQKFWANVAIRMLFCLIMAVGMLTTNDLRIWPLFFVLAVGGSIAASKAMGD